MNNNSATCHAWIKDYISNKTVTLADVNDLLILRFLGGILFLSILMVLGLIGNAHVLFIYYRKFRHTNYRIYVIWLAVLDIFNCGIVIPCVIYYLLHPVNYKYSSFCKQFRFMLYFAGLASTASLVPIAIDRGRKVLLPLKSKVTATQAKVMCAISLIVGIVLSWPVPIMFGINSEPTGIQGITGYRCLVEDKYTKSKEIIIFNLVNFAFCFLVIILLLIIYATIGRSIWTHRFVPNTPEKSEVQNNASAEGLDQHTSGSISSRVYRSTITLLLVTFVYIISALMYHVLSLIYFLNPGFDCSLSLPQSVIYYTFIWSYFVNSACNPFIYGFRDHKFRNELKLLYNRC